MISEIRSVIAGFVMSIDPNLRQWDDALNYDNIPSSILNNRFHIIYQAENITRLQVSERYTIKVDLRLFFGGAKYTSAQYDLAMNKAEFIKNAIVAMDTLPSGYISINCTAIDAEAISRDNDNKIVLTIRLSVIKHNVICGG